MGKTKKGPSRTQKDPGLEGKRSDSKLLPYQEIPAYEEKKPDLD